MEARQLQLERQIWLALLQAARRDGADVLQRLFWRPASALIGLVDLGNNHAAACEAVALGHSTALIAETCRALQGDVMPEGKPAW